MAFFPAEIIYECSQTQGEILYQNSETDGDPYIWVANHFGTNFHYSGWMLKIDVDDIPADTADITDAELTLTCVGTNANNNFSDISYLSQASAPSDWTSSASPKDDWAGAIAETGTTTWDISGVVTGTAYTTPNSYADFVTALDASAEVSGFKYVAMLAKGDAAGGTVGQWQAATDQHATESYHPVFEFQADVVIDVNITSGVDFDTPLAHRIGTGTATTVHAGITYDSDAYITYPQDYDDGYGDDTDRTADVSTPFETPPVNGFPVQVFFRGGGYAELTGQPGWMIQWAATRHMAYVSVDYKLTSANDTVNIGSNHPEPVQDALCAIGWMNESDTFDLSNYTINGHSAGGHLALEAFLMMNDEGNYLWNYDAGGERREQLGFGYFDYVEGSPDRVGLPLPRGIWIWAGAVDWDQAYSGNTLLREPMKNYLGGDNLAVFTTGYAAADADYHNGEINIYDMMHGVDEGATGNSVWQSNIRFDNTAGEIVGDSRHFINPPIAYLQAYSDAAVGPTAGITPLRNAIEDFGISAQTTAAPASLNSSTGTLDPKGGLSHYWYRSDAINYLAHDRCLTWFDYDMYYDWYDAIDTNVTVHVPAPMAAGTVGDVTTEVTAPAVKPDAYQNPNTLGVPTVNQVIRPTAYQNSNTLGTPDVTLLLAPAGYQNPNTLGVPVVTQVLHPDGYQNPNSYGVPELRQVIHPSGYQNPNSYGVPSIEAVGADQTINPDGYQNSNGFGVPTVNQTMAAVGYQNSNALGVPSIGLLVSPTGYQNPNAFGTPDVTQIIYPAGHQNTNTFGTADVTNADDPTQYVTPDGFQNTNTFGAPQVNHILEATGYQNTNTFGTPVLNQIISPAGYQNTNAFGVPTWEYGTQVVEADGYQNTNTFGSPKVNQVILVVAYQNANDFGIVVMAGTVTPDGYQNSNNFGTAQVNQIISPSGYQNTNSFGTPIVGEIRTPDGYQNTNTFGTVTINQIIRPAGYQNDSGFGITYIPQSATDDMFLMFIATY